jgi:serine/threonine protein kinase
MWSVGVLLYLLIGGYPPYQDDSHRGLFRKIRAAGSVFHETYWEHVSVEAKRLIASLMCVNPEFRWTAGRALPCSWIQAEDETSSTRSLGEALEELRRFNARRKLKSAITAVHWATTATFWNADNVTFSQQQKTWDNADAAVATKETLHLSFRDLYQLKKKLRTGSFATVWECVHIETQNVYAVKVINREGLKPVDDEAVMNEVAILQSLTYKHIVQLLDFFEEKDYFFIVMDYMTGGDVFDRIVEKNHYTEKDARDLVRILLKAVRYMHGQGVAHRDLKPQNLLLKVRMFLVYDDCIRFQPAIYLITLQSKDNDSDIRIADFGFSRRVHTPQSLTNRCGTPTYVAPEILKNIPHDTKADMWSVGVIIYVLLVGYPPFMEDKQADLFRKIRSGEYEFFEEELGRHIRRG